MKQVSNQISFFGPSAHQLHQIHPNYIPFSEFFLSVVSSSAFGHRRTHPGVTLDPPERRAPQVSPVLSWPDHLKTRAARPMSRMETTLRSPSFTCGDRGDGPNNGPILLVPRSAPTSRNASTSSLMKYWSWENTKKHTIQNTCKTTWAFSDLRGGLVGVHSSKESSALRTSVKLCLLPSPSPYFPPHAHSSGTGRAARRRR